MQTKKQIFTNFFNKFSRAKNREIKLTKRQLTRVACTYIFEAGYIPTAKELDLIEGTIEALEMIEAFGILEPREAEEGQVSA